MREPDQRNLDWQLLAGQDSVGAQQDRPDLDVDEVIGDCARPRVDQEDEEGEVGARKRSARARC